MYPGHTIYPLDTGAVDVMNGVRRSVGVPGGGTAATSAGGVAANAFDNSVTTFCTQTSINGNISYDFGAGKTFTPVMFGILPNGTATYNLVYEHSPDGVTWTTQYAPGSQSYTNAVWTLNDVDIPVADRFWRVRETGGGTLNVIEVMFGSNPYDISIARVSNDVYANMTNKFNTGIGTVPLQYWVDRQQTLPKLVVWPSPNSSIIQIVVYRRRHIQDVGNLTNTLEIPQRWIDAIVKGLAERLILRLDVPEAKRQEIFLRLPIIKQEAADAKTMASMEERDSSPVSIMPMMGAYTGYGG